MTRVAIIGNAAGGKSTLARRLSAARSLPCHALDALLWRPGWQPVAQDAFDEGHDAILANERWIIDGFGDLASIGRRIAAADTVVLVDHPLWIHLWWATKRQIRSLFADRPDGPEGCPMWQVTFRLYAMIWRIHRELRPQIHAMVATAGTGTAVFHLRSPRALAAFERQYC